MRIHFVIGKKDADIAYWVKSLPYGCFSNYVVKILKAESKKKTANIPVPPEEGLLFRNIDTSIYVKDKQIINMIINNNLGKKTPFIKKVIRKHIALNYKRISRQNTTGDDKETPVVEEKEMTSSIVVEEPAEPKTEESVKNDNDEPTDDFYARMLKLAKH